MPACVRACLRGAAAAAAGWTLDAARTWFAVAPPPPPRDDGADAVDLQQLMDFAVHMG
jgi:hypothetical protein